MTIFKQAKEITKYLESRKKMNNSLGFVPTMGALHEGHLSLLKKAGQVSDITICSIFVNPAQFNNAEDLKKYPKPLENDILLLEENGCDVLFLPDEKEIYPDEKSKQRQFDLGYLETILEGKFRPGHFQGVSLVMEKLLTIINPDILFLGQKDFQQCLVIKKLAKLANKNIKIVICPIIREPGGLAMSSRNTRLNDFDRKLASQLHKTLVSIKTNLNNENFTDLKKKAIEHLESNGFSVEYLELARKSDLKIFSHFNEKQDLVILIAAFLSGVRLIDNVFINP